MTRGKKIVLFAIAAAVPIALSRAAQKRPLATVPSVDLARYAGRWYEIARLPNRFQRECASDTTADYTLQPGGKVSVLNRCRTAAGVIKSASGTARPASGARSNAKLKVTFFWPFSGDYWIIALDPEYRWALVGEPGRRYLWILARRPEMDENLFRSVAAIARAEGFDTDRLIRTRHNQPVGAAT